MLRKLGQRRNCPAMRVTKPGTQAVVPKSVGTKASVLARLIAAGRATPAAGDVLKLGAPLGRQPSQRASRALASLRG